MECRTVLAWVNKDDETKANQGQFEDLAKDLEWLHWRSSKEKMGMFCIYVLSGYKKQMVYIPKTVMVLFRNMDSMDVLGSKRQNLFIKHSFQASLNNNPSVCMFFFYYFILYDILFISSILLSHSMVGGNGGV